MTPQQSGIELGLHASIVSVHRNEPHVVCVTSPENQKNRDSLPFGVFTPLAHRTLEIGLRNWVEEQTGLSLGYVEQLYTFGDRGRHAREGDSGPHMVSIGYLALTLQTDIGIRHVRQRRWYDFFPWEDWRHGRPEMVETLIEPLLLEWCEQTIDSDAREHPLGRKERIRFLFGLNGANWDEEKVLDRYELLYEAGLLKEAAIDGRTTARAWNSLPELGRPMNHDHRRILATAMSRMRGKLKYRPLVFELLPPVFTLYELQKVVEAISGTPLHKQNFRRLVEGGGFVETTGEMKKSTGGRPAKLFKFRRVALVERPSPERRANVPKITG
ncbi:MAG: NAD regulator [bacterium]|nr:NAD regulator [bacterium]